MRNQTMTTVSIRPDGKVEKKVVEMKDGIKTEKIFIDGVEQQVKVAPTEKAPKKEFVIQTPFGPMNITEEDMQRLQKAQEEAERHAKELEEMKKAAEEQKKKLEEQKQRIKEATEQKIKEEVKAFKKAKEEHGRFLVRFFVPGEQVRIAEKRFHKPEDIYRPQLGECVYLGNWIVDEDGNYDKYYDVRFVVTDVTYCLEDEYDGTALIDIDIEPCSDDCYTLTGWDC